MLTLMLFISVEANTVLQIDMYSNAWDCGIAMDAKIAEYYPLGLPREIYVVCEPTDIIGTSAIPPLRGASKIQNRTGF